MKTLVIFLLAALSVFSASSIYSAADPTPTLLTPGTYVASVMPGFNHDMAARIEKGLGQIPGLDSVSTKTDDSSVRFTVKEKNKVNLVDIQKSLDLIDKGAVMTTPVLAHTLSSNPGL